MEKYCPKCGRVYKGKDSKAKFCMFCATPLEKRESRIPFSKNIRDKVFKRDGYRCVRCGASNKEKRLEVDHIIPISRGGTNDIDNLQTLCWECNKDKGAVIPDLGLKHDIEIKENELKTLNRLLQENKNKLNTSTNENDRKKYANKIKQLEKNIFPVRKELNELKNKYPKEKRIDDVKINKIEKEILFNKLYVELSSRKKSILKNHFNLNNLTNDAMLKRICEKYSEDEIIRVIENYNTTSHKTLEKTITFDMLPLISSELSLNTTSKETIINHLINNYDNTQINALIDKVKTKEYKYNTSFNNIEKSILKKHFNLNVSDDRLIQYMIKNDFSIEELKNTIKLFYKNIFQQYYNQLDEYQQYLVSVRFKNQENNLVDFLVINNYSLEKLKEELNKTKLELFDKTYNSLNHDKKSLIERYSNNYSPDFNLIDYLYKNKFNLYKIDELVELSKKELLNDIHQNLNGHEMILLNYTFENENDLIIFMIEHNYSINSLMEKLQLTEKQNFLLKRYFSITTDQSMKKYLVDNNLTFQSLVELIANYKKCLHDEFDKNLTPNYEQILYKAIPLKLNSKEELIDYLIYENYTVDSMKTLIKESLFSCYDKISNEYSQSWLCHKFNITPSNKTELYDFLFNNEYTLSTIKQLIEESEKEIIDKLKIKIDFYTVKLMTKDLNLPNSKNGLISYLMENYTFDYIKEFVKQYSIIL